MGTHKLLYDQTLLPLLQGQEIPKPHGQGLMLDAQSPPALLAKYPGELARPTSNFLRMARTGWLLWAVRHGTSADVDDAVLGVQDVLARERREGLWLREQLSNDPHNQFHFSAEVALRIAATEGQLPALLQQSSERWDALLALYDLLATPDGEILGPSTRAGQDRGDRQYSLPVTQVGTAVYRLLRGFPALGPSHGDDWWTDPVYGGGAPSALRRLLQTGDRIISGAVAKPHLRLPMTVRRYTRGHLAWIEGHREDQPICDWVRVEYSQPGHHQYTHGYDWETPVDDRPFGSQILERRFA
jgi:hypothetical protein